MGNLSRIRGSPDLWSVQLTTSYFASFIRDYDPNPSLQYLDQRRYEKVIEGVTKYGQWQQVDGGKNNSDELRLLDWPSTSAPFTDVEQCAWLGYPLDYYMKGGI